MSVVGAFIKIVIQVIKIILTIHGLNDTFLFMKMFCYWNMEQNNLPLGNPPILFSYVQAYL